MPPGTPCIAWFCLLDSVPTKGTAAFGGSTQKRQRTAALQDAGDRSAAQLLLRLGIARTLLLRQVLECRTEPFMGRLQQSKLLSVWSAARPRSVAWECRW